MKTHLSDPSWDFEPAITLLKSLSLSPSNASQARRTPVQALDHNGSPKIEPSLGDFSLLWDFLGRPRILDLDDSSSALADAASDCLNVDFDTDVESFIKAVRWRDELDGEDLEDNVEPELLPPPASQKTLKRAARRARARQRANELQDQPPLVSDTATDAESGEELESLRQALDAVTSTVDGQTRKELDCVNSPPTSPSPPKTITKILKREIPISNPFQWPKQLAQSYSQRQQTIRAIDDLSSKARKEALISKLSMRFPSERRYLSNPGLYEPTFTALNTSDIGVHVFVDISNIMIGFHDCLKLARNIPRETRIRRIPMSFHNFSLVLERGRPAAKRVLVGSDKFPIVQQAKSIGFETNILERVHKAKEATPRQKKFRSGAASSGMETSGSETNTGPALEKWVEQAVDEILHLKILESLVDADKPSTIVLATGDAAEAEYSGGFMRMVERALEKGWMVELVSFKLNTSSAYKRREFRAKWGAMFKWVQLDDFVESLIDADEADTSQAG